MKRAPTRDILWLFTGTRFILIMVTYFAYILLTAAKYSSTPVDTTALFSSWAHWDAANYIRIARFGYNQLPYDVAFFPLYPLMITAIAHVFGGRGYLIIGTLISNGALLGALFVIYQMATDIGGDQVARRTLLYLCIFPTAFYFFAAYNESLFILLTAGALLAMRRQKWWLAGALGCLAALTRSAGVLLVIPYLVELWVSRESVTATRWKLILSTLPIILIPVGTLLYAIYCWYLLGDPLAFVMVQSHWGRHTTWPWMGIYRATADLLRHQPFGSFNEAHIILDLSATLGFIALAFLGRHKLRLTYTVWVAVLLFYVLLSPGTDKTDVLLSNQRFVLEMFPAFITLAILGIKHPRLHQALLLVFPTLLATLSVIFIMNLWMV